MILFIISFVFISFNFAYAFSVIELMTPMLRPELVVPVNLIELIRFALVS